MRNLHPWTFPVLAPLLLAQGFYVRRVTPRLPEAEGPRTGAIGQGRPLQVLIAGDSAAAGVGAPHQAQALSGQLARLLEHRFQLSWLLEATSGHTTLQAIEVLNKLAPQRFDVAIISLGVNDVTSGVKVSAWIARLRQLEALLASRFQVGHVLLVRLPPMHLFPALPQPLRWYLGQRAVLFNRELERHVQGSALCEVVHPDLNALSTASDGFHPSPGVFAAWAAAVAERIRIWHGES
jgi:lysophospholipase L1-like esterase